MPPSSALCCPSACAGREIAAAGGRSLPKLGPARLSRASTDNCIYSHNCDRSSRQFTSIRQSGTAPFAAGRFGRRHWTELGRLDLECRRICPPGGRTRGSMRLSEYFLPLLRENPSEAQIVSHRLMLRAGMIRQSSAGIYSWLPLGLRVLKKVEQIVREEQDRAGAQEILMPTIQPAELWRESGRYDDYGKEMLRIRDRHDREMLYGPTNEEQVTEIVRAAIKSYRDLPKLSTTSNGSSATRCGRALA